LPIKIQPSREAEIIYRIVGQHRGGFPKRELVAIWRQLINATLSFEGPFSVAAYLPEGEPGYWDLARDQYGAYTPMSRHASARSLIEAVRRHEAIVGVLPLPRAGDDDPWWRHLVMTEPDAPRIIARLPFAGPANNRGGDLHALVICTVGLRPTGRDRSYLAADLDPEVGPGSLAAALGKAGLPSVVTAQLREMGSLLCLVEVEGFVDAGDRRLDAVRAEMGKALHRLILLGGYAEPLLPAELETAADAGAAAQRTADAKAYAP
jgi:chorismate mutase / prephenate dehydratase